jgi:hypothetical protein
MSVTEAQFEQAVEGLVRCAADKLGQAVDLENDRLDDQIRKIENMDADDLEALRERRIAQLKRKAEQRQSLMAKGHGQYREITETKQFFQELKEAKLSVVHFYRDATERCRIVDKHLGILAPKYVETKFIKVNAEKQPYLAEKLHIYMLPTIVLIKDGKTDHSIIGFDEMGGGDDFPTEMLEWVLGKWKVIPYEGDQSMPPVGEDGGVRNPFQKATKSSLRSGMEDSDDDWDLD